MGKLVGQKLGGYELVERLGRGGMAEVYKGYHPKTKQYAAVKILHAHLGNAPEMVERFKLEARAIGKLQHPHIMRLIDFDVTNDLYYIVLQYLEGYDLREYLKSKKMLPVAEALYLMAQLVDALEYAHQKEMLHRDIKPANIMFADESYSHAVLTDFGLARLLDETGLTISGTRLGTPAYMSPEGAQGNKVDERADIYSLGVILYEMVTGRLPYEGQTPYAMLLKLIHDPLPPPRSLKPDLPLIIEKLLLKALAKEPTERYQSASAFKEAIAEAELALTGRQSAAVSQYPKTGQHKRTGNRADEQATPWLILALVAVGVLVIAFLVVQLLGVG
jgi:serine/threonine-protein kinase